MKRVLDVYLHRHLVGELAEVATTSTRAVREVLRQTGFRFQTSGLREALAWELQGRA
jgi:NAD dependent epimerase/dehydratase family enzyme